MRGELSGSISYRFWPRKGLNSHPCCMHGYLHVIFQSGLSHWDCRNAHFTLTKYQLFLLWLKEDQWDEDDLLSLLLRCQCVLAYVDESQAPATCLSSFQPSIYGPVGGKWAGLPLFHWWPLLCGTMFRYVSCPWWSSASAAAWLFTRFSPREYPFLFVHFCSLLRLSSCVCHSDSFFIISTSLTSFVLLCVAAVILVLIIWCFSCCLYTSSSLLLSRFTNVVQILTEFPENRR